MLSTHIFHMLKVYNQAACMGGAPSHWMERGPYTTSAHYPHPKLALKEFCQILSLLYNENDETIKI